VFCGVGQEQAFGDIEQGKLCDFIAQSTIRSGQTS
jgi:hypothetical protein